MMTEPVNITSENLTFEKVMALIHENSRKFQESLDRSNERFEREMEKRREEDNHRREEENRRRDEENRRRDEYNRQKEEEEKHRKIEDDRRKVEYDLRQKKLDREFRKTEKIVGDLGNRFGEMAEHLVAPGIIKKFNKLGFKFNKTISNGMVIWENEDKYKTEIDIYLENHEYIIAVEVKAKPKEQDIEHHIKRLQIIREDREPGDQKKILGAIAGAVYPEDVKAAVLEAGMYVLEQSGDTMKIKAPEQNKLRNW